MTTSSLSPLLLLLRFSPPKKKWTPKEDPALLKQQMGNYRYYSSFTITASNYFHIQSMSTLRALRYTKKFSTIWKAIMKKMGMSTLDHINEDKFKEIQEGLIKIDEEWVTYKPTHAKTTYRGDTLHITNSYLWLKEFVQSTVGGKVRKLKVISRKIKLLTIMSTSQDVKMSYISNKMVLWEFELCAGNQGVEQGTYKAKKEVTFSLYSEAYIQSIEYLPKGRAYKDDKKTYGKNHRYVIRATILPFLLSMKL
ncbi:hypothetical protein C1646_770532 [Rhizophagus diaphanus]|nr:hypothetical protein C1646_770532 [Rhizophagus diaphanus] [Rhizophagus sp. MUCL 43196]